MNVLQKDHENLYREEIEKIERYRLLLDMVKYHQTIVWGPFQSFVLTNSIFLGIFARYAIEVGLTAQSKPHWGVVAASVMGFIFWLPWYVTYQRSNYYFLFRLEQAKRAEPEGLNILRGSMERLTDYGEVFVDNKRYKLPFPVNILQTRKVIPLFIFGYAAIYVFFGLSQIPIIKKYLIEAF
ncbi:MAG: hypothetical protein HOP03_08695 [Lysobacter sp.]|nr:hypothetical protein [Lysobacter sp.]